MSSQPILGILLVAVAGLLIGSGVWPMRLVRHYRFEHWWFIAMLTGLVVIPWTVMLGFCPNVWVALGRIPVGTLLVANLWSVGWGVANLLSGLCFLRIGVALTAAILTGLGAAIGVTLPMVVKGSGRFQHAPDLGSPAGLTVLAGVGVMLAGVGLAALAGLGRERALERGRARAAGGFVVGLVMAMVAGVLSCGMGLAFVYGQGPIMQALQASGAGEIPATFGVWAVGLLGGAIVNLAYPLHLMVRAGTLGILVRHGREGALVALIGINLAVGVVLMGSGMRALGALGASVGFGVQQATQMLGSQVLGFVGGEWRGIAGRPRHLMYAAIACLVLAAAVMAWGNRLAR